MIFKEHSEVMQLLYDMALYYGLALIIDEDGIILGDLNASEGVDGVIFRVAALVC